MKKCACPPQNGRRPKEKDRVTIKDKTMNTLSYHNRGPGAGISHHLRAVGRSPHALRMRPFAPQVREDEAVFKDMGRAQCPRKACLEDGLRVIQARIAANRPRT